LLLIAYGVCACTKIEENTGKVEKIAYFVV